MILPISFDAAGHASFPVTNPGFAQAFDAIAQTVVVSTSGAIGASAALPLQVGQ